MNKSILLLLLLTSCTQYTLHTDNQTIRVYNPKNYPPTLNLTNATPVNLSQELPANTQCPICKQKAYYIQSLIPQDAKMVYSRYYCKRNHHWLFGQNDLQGKIKQIVILQ